MVPRVGNETLRPLGFEPCFGRKLQTKKLVMFRPAALILWHAGSDVMGCRRPTGGVFSYVSSDRVTLRAFPVATPRGRSVSFPTRGTMVTYVTWDDFNVWHPFWFVEQTTLFYQQQNYWAWKHTLWERQSNTKTYRALLKTLKGLQIRSPHPAPPTNTKLCI